MRIKKRIKTILIGLRSFGNNRLKVTWARPRARNRSHRHDPNMRCYKCGQRGHFRWVILFLLEKFNDFYLNLVANVMVK